MPIALHVLLMQVDVNTIVSEPWFDLPRYPTWCMFSVDAVDVLIFVNIGCRPRVFRLHFMQDGWNLHRMTDKMHSEERDRCKLGPEAASTPTYASCKPECSQHNSSSSDGSKSDNTRARGLEGPATVLFSRTIRRPSSDPIGNSSIRRYW
jgi:hypothetical protein